MVTKEEFGQLISEFEALRDITMEEMSKVREDIENLKESLNDVIKEAKLDISRKIN